MLIYIFVSCFIIFAVAFFTKNGYESASMKLNNEKSSAIESSEDKIQTYCQKKYEGNEALCNEILRSYQE